MKLYTAFIFDMDGTMIDNMPFHIQTWLAFWQELGISMTEAEFHRRLSGKTNAETLREVLGPDVPAAEMARLARRKEVAYRELYRPHMRPVAGLPAFLQAARSLGVKTAVATSAGPDNVTFVLQGLNLADQFDAIVGAQHVQNGKPHPDIFLVAAERLQTPPAACLVFEDSHAGIEAARRAGMDVCVITTALTDAQARVLPHVIDSAPDFTGLDPAQFHARPGA
jgi:beta-phosphoglucomutase family hydrolase